MNGVKLAFCCTESAPDTFIFIHNRRAASKTSGSFRLYLFLCKHRPEIPETFFRNTGFPSGNLTFRIIKFLNYDIILIQFRELSQIAPQSQGMTLMDKAVNRLAALFSRGNRVDCKTGGLYIHLRQQKYPALLSDM